MDFLVRKENKSATRGARRDKKGVFFCFLPLGVQSLSMREKKEVFSLLSLATEYARSNMNNSCGEHFCVLGCFFYK